MPGMNFLCIDPDQRYKQDDCCGGLCSLNGSEILDWGDDGSICNCGIAFNYLSSIIQNIIVKWPEGSVK